MNKQKNIIHSIQLMRLLLAIFVVFSHIGLFIINSFQTTHPHILIGAKAVYPEIAVTTFIAISGFVMYFSVKHTDSAKRFIINRFIRIIPIYFVLTFFAIIAIKLFSMTFSTLSSPHDPVTKTHLIKSLLFLDPKPIIYSGWSLNYEVYFYVICAVVLLFKTKHRTFLLFLLTGFVVLLQFCYTPILQPYITNHLTLQIFFGLHQQFFIYFLIGMLIAFMYENKFYIQNSLLGLLFIVLGLGSGYVFMTNRIWQYFALTLTLPSALILYGLIHIVIKNEKFQNFSILAAELSYPTYLSHFFIIIGAQALILKTSLFSYLHPYWLYPILIIASLLLAYIVNYFDKKLTHFLKKKLLSK